MPLVPANTPRLGIARPADSDPFTRQYLIDAFDKIDTYPGVFPCTSTTRPSWGAAQAGQCIQETDTGRILRWDGTAWSAPEVYGRSWRLANNVSQTLTSGQSPDPYVLGTITTIRPCTINLVMLVGITKGASTPQNLNAYPYLDGTDCHFGLADWAGFPDGPSGTTNNYHQNLTVLGGRTNVAAGDHTIACKVAVGSGFSASINLAGIKALVTLSE